ncbi:MAG: nitroreductase [Xanthomonadales bacterium]|nr:nitroreductase [Xanthomonadales bacterium]
MSAEIRQFLNNRGSVPSRLLGDPGPDPAQLQRILEGAMRVPDHGRLAPWRYLLIERAAGPDLGEWLVRRLLQRDPDASEMAIEKERERFLRAPLTVVVVASPEVGHKVPEVEQLLSAGCVGMLLLLHAELEGLGAQWLTGWPAYDEIALRILGVEAHEKVVGFIHIGTAQGEAPPRERPSYEQLVREWRPADMPAI